MRFFTKQKTPGWFAIRASEQGTYVAHVINNPRTDKNLQASSNQDGKFHDAKLHGTKPYGGKPLVAFGAHRPESLKDDAAVKTLATGLSLASQHCSLLLAQGEYQLLQIEKPNVPADELKQAVSWKLKDMIDYPVEQATIEVIDIPADPNNINRQSYVYAVAAKNELIGSYIKRLIEFSGSGLEAIDIPELAQRNIAAYLEQEGRGLAMLTINSGGGLLTFTSGGELYHARNIEIDTKQLQSEDSAKKSSVFERLSLEIQRSLDNFERQFPYITINRLVLAPFMGREDFYDYLKSSLYVQIDRFDLNDIFDFESSVELGDLLDNLAMQASLLPALGAALRGSTSS